MLGTIVLITTRKLLAPIVDMTSLFRDIAEGEGDLTKKIPIFRDNEIGEACSLFNIFIDKLHGIIGQVAQTTTQLASASHQMFTTSEQLSSDCEQLTIQAGTVATASEEMATTNEIATSYR